MSEQCKSVDINGTKYIRADLVDDMRPASADGLPYCIIRGDRSGVFAGYVRSARGVRLSWPNSRRLWYWDGAASISQLANDGTSRPQNCKFPAEVANQLVLDAIEVIPATEKARKSIEGVTRWAK
jgi:hypothetical protein